MKRKESGFIMLLMVVALVVGASYWLVGGSQTLLLTQKDRLEQQKWLTLEKIKAKLLQYAVLSPELLSTENTGSSSPTLIALQESAGVGYLPCPDNSANGEVDASCGNNDSTINVVAGYLPVNIKGRHVFFGHFEKTRYSYAVDERFVSRNNSLSYSGSIQPKRFSPLNFSLSDRPILHLNNNGRDYVALIIDTGSAITPLAAENSDGDTEFVSVSNGVTDKILGITYNEWKILVKKRVCSELTRASAVSGGDGTPADIYWLGDFDSTTNPAGGDWEDIRSSCP